MRGHRWLAPIALSCVLLVGWAAGRALGDAGSSRVLLPLVVRGFAERPLLANGDFEAGAVAWESDCACITSAGPLGVWRGGRLGARLGSRAGQRVWQTVSAPAGFGRVRFGFWYQYLTEAPDPFLLSDRFTVTVRDAASGEVVFWRQVWARDGLTASWQREGADLPARPGRRLVLELEAFSPSGKTRLFVDDVELIAGSSVARVVGRTPTAARPAGETGELTGLPEFPPDATPTPAARYP